MARIHSCQYTDSPGLKPVLRVTFLPGRHTTRELHTCLDLIENTLRQTWGLPGSPPTPDPEPVPMPPVARPAPKAPEPKAPPPKAPARRK